MPGMKIIGITGTLGAAKGRAAMSDAMDANWREVYELADLVAERHVRDGAAAAFVEGDAVERLSGAATDFDAAWKEKL